MLKNKYLNYPLFINLLLLISTQINKIFTGSTDTTSASSLDNNNNNNQNLNSNETPKSKIALKREENSKILSLEEGFIYLIERVLSSKNTRQQIYKEMGVK